MVDWRARRSATCAPIRRRKRSPISIRRLGVAALFALQGEVSDRRGAAIAGGKLDIESLGEGSAIAAEKALTAQRGIGIWTARYVLMRGGFADAAPVGDSALATALQRLHKLPERPDADEHGAADGALRPIAASPPCICGLICKEGSGMSNYWSLIDSPFQKFAAWVDEEGRLLRFNLRAAGAAKVDPEAENNSRKLADVQRQVTEYAQGQAPRFRFELAAKGRSSTKRYGRRCWIFLSAPPPLMARWPNHRPSHRGPRGGRGERANPIALIVPCHRVIGADGSLTGYGGGLPLKRKLLEHEARVCGTRLDLFGDPLRFRSVGFCQARAARALSSLKPDLPLAGASRAKGRRTRAQIAFESPKKNPRRAPNCGAPTPTPVPSRIL